MRLIDADKLLSIVRSMTVVDKSVIHRILIQMPTVDAVEVVRCRDCKHHDGIRCFRWNSTIITGFNDYCSNGERKDDDHDEG